LNTRQFLKHRNLHALAKLAIKLQYHKYSDRKQPKSSCQAAACRFKLRRAKKHRKSAVIINRLCSAPV